MGRVRVGVGVVFTTLTSPQLQPQPHPFTNLIPNPNITFPNLNSNPKLFKAPMQTPTATLVVVLLFWLPSFTARGSS